jgi:ubiquinone/menaquinone biosynthesis C-methylase UbiE
MDSKSYKIENLYSKNFYIKKNPSLHKEDSGWKVKKIKSLVDEFIKITKIKKIKLLDIGGGAGIILKIISSDIKKRHKIAVEKNILDLSPEMLKIQRKNNPEVKKILNQNISQTTLKNKEIDLTLLIDVLEHLETPQKALEEISRISRYAIFKVPLEHNLLYILINLIKNNKLKDKSRETVGHINIYNFSGLIKETEKHCGKVIRYQFTNVSNYYQKSKKYKQNSNPKRKIIDYMATKLFIISPRISSLFFKDFVVILVECK